MLLFVIVGCTSNEAQLKKMVAEANRTAYPKQLDEITRLDSLSVKPGLKLYTHYTLTDLDEFNFTSEQLEMWKLDMKMRMLQTIILDNAEVKRFRNAGVTFLFEYRDINGDLIMEFEVTPEEYKRAMKD